MSENIHANTYKFSKIMVGITSLSLLLVLGLTVLAFVKNNETQNSLMVSGIVLGLSIASLIHSFLNNLFKMLDAREAIRK